MNVRKDIINRVNKYIVTIKIYNGEDKNNKTFFL